MGLVRRLVTLADRAPSRSLLIGAVNRMGPLKVAYDGDFWIYRYNGVALPRSRRFDFYRWDLENLPRRIDHYRHETSDCWFYRYKPRPGDTIVDVGAEIGTDTVFFSRAVGLGGRVIAIEAVAETYRMLLATIEANALPNVAAHHLAVAAEPGTVHISTDKGVESNFLCAEGEPVQADSLDNILAAVPRIDFLKMNIEGAERLAIQGMDETLAKTDRLAIACHDFIGRATGDAWFNTLDLVVAYLEARGFAVTIRDDDPREYVRYHVHAARPSHAEPMSDAS